MTAAGKTRTIVVLAAVLSVLMMVLQAFAGDDARRGPFLFDRSDPGVQAAIVAQGRQTPWLMTRPDVVGTAVGLTEDGRPAILVMTRTTPGPGIPGTIDGVPVVVRVTGEIIALKGPPPGKGGGSTTAGFDTTARAERPVPIGISTGNAAECSAGTIGARVTDGTSVYALSNNHVFALENQALVGGTLLQPGAYDTLCAVSQNDSIGTLWSYVPIVFSRTAANTVDAALGLTTTGLLGNSTPPDGYGTALSTIADATLGERVQKYGRTTQLTRGEVVGLNATVDVSYGSGVARFVGQVVVGANKPFIKAGDSGSLLVRDPGLEPVGLLFAGNSSGKYAIANPISDVLGALGVSIDGN